MHLVTTNGTQDSGCLIGKLRENVQVVATDARLDGFIQLRPLFQLFNNASSAWNVAVQLGTELRQEFWHIVICAGVDQDLSQIVGRLLRRHVVIETRGGAT